MTVAPMKLPALPAIYEQYETVSRLREERFSHSLAGKLLLRSCLNADGLADVVATGIAGGCAVCVEPNAESLREALRAGLCDFVVGLLDEALRILKNELRRGRPISVGITADPESTLAEMTVRGLQPDLVSLPPGEPLRIFVERGAVRLPAHEGPEPDNILVEWTIAEPAARVMPGIARIAETSLDAKRPDTPLRKRWLESAPRHLGRAFAACHCVRMTPAEASVFVTAARAQFPALHIASGGSAL